MRMKAPRLSAWHLWKTARFLENAKDKHNLHLIAKIHFFLFFFLSFCIVAPGLIIAGKRWRAC